VTEKTVLLVYAPGEYDDHAGDRPPGDHARPSVGRPRRTGQPPGWSGALLPWGV